MKNFLSYFFALSLLILFIPVMSYSQKNQSAGSISYLKYFEEFNKIGQSTCLVSDIDSLTMVRDVAKFNLKKGKIYLFPAVGGKQIAAMFIGKGVFSITPPSKIEQDQFLKFYKKGSPLEFGHLFILFNDLTLAELNKASNFKPESGSFELRDITKYFLSYVEEKSNNYLQEEVFQSLIDTSKNGYFYTQMFDSKLNPFFFEINPFSQEEITFSRGITSSRGVNTSETICQFPMKRRENQKVDAGSKDLFKNNSYKIDINIESDLDFYAVADVKSTILKKNLQWIYFDIYSEMKIDSIVSSDHKKMEFYKPDENNEIWIHLDKVYNKYDDLSLKFYYQSSKIFESNSDSWIYFKSPILWLPSYGDDQLALFDLTYHYSDTYKLVSVGDSVSSSVKNGIVTSHWITPHPIRYASFNIGYFKENRFKKDDSTTVIVLTSKAGHWSGDMSKEIAFDIMNCIGFYGKLFGPIPHKRLYVSETPYLLGLAYPGLINLSWATYEKQNRKGFDEFFRAHEVAHQWWGIDVGFKTYHDQWLSEGMAEFLGRWYMQIVFNDNKRFFDMMEISKDNIIKNRKFLFSDGQQAAPISLGYRTSTTDTQGDYDLIIYEKGAWVLHMLRMIMINLDTMSEDKFINMLRDVYKSNSNKLITTEIFQSCVEKHMNLKMDWFFKEWVYESALPKYKVAYELKDAPDGKCLLKCKIKQENVPDDFVMPMLIKISYGGDKYSLISKWINKGVKEYQFGLPGKPDDVVFNYFDSILAEVEKVSYNDL
jgi:hypothetical protein